jgi:hypothetical protein
MLNNDIFLIFESRYNDLKNIIDGNEDGKIIMGEVKWFYSLIRHLADMNYTVIICENIEIFFNEYYKNINKTCHLIMDYRTIPITIHKLYENINNIFCMCYWGRDEKRILQLGTVNNMNILLKNVLTPFNYNNNNTYLGYDLKYLCNSYINNKYKNIGVLWGKKEEYINLELVKYLIEKGLEFYCVTNEFISINGINNLGILNKNEWCQLLNDAKYILSFGHPVAGPTILESLYYKKIMFGPSRQYPKSIHNTNIFFTDNLSNEEIYKLIILNTEFKCDETYLSLVSSKYFNDRVKTIFKLN